MVELQPSAFRPHVALAGSGERAALSPDETLVAYAVRPLSGGTAARSAVAGVPAQVAGSELRLTALEDGAMRVLTPAEEGWGSSWGPVWSPDGRALAFYADRWRRTLAWLDRYVRS